MWLINTTNFNLEYFVARPPPYATLSHRWGPKETSFQEWTSGHRDPSKPGIRKLVSACDQARYDNYPYLWADTACIDKTSSAELSESINSMFLYYKRSGICYAYLDDFWINDDEAPPSVAGHGVQARFCDSLWFTRGWTLQELLAPDDLVFFDATWLMWGYKVELAAEISAITGIGARFIEGDALDQASNSERMSWVSNRITTRLEDIAYCMMGIFNINMPLLYGEGPKAFVRLQEELIKISGDQTIFAWDFLPASTKEPGFPQRRHEYLQNVALDWQSQSRSTMLAPDPVCFARSAEFVPTRYRPHDEWEETPASIVNLGLCIGLVLIEAGPLSQSAETDETAAPKQKRDHAIAFLEVADRKHKRVCFALRRHTNKTYSRQRSAGSLLLVEEEERKMLRHHAKFREIFVRRVEPEGAIWIQMPPYMARRWRCQVGVWPVGHASEHIGAVVGSVRWTILEHGGIIGRDDPVLGRTSLVLESGLVAAESTNDDRVMLTIVAGESKEQHENQQRDLPVNESLNNSNSNNKNLGWSLTAGKGFTSNEFTARHSYKQESIETATPDDICRLTSLLRLGCEVYRPSQPDLKLRFLVSLPAEEDASSDKIKGSGTDSRTK